MATYLPLLKIVGVVPEPALSCPGFVVPMFSYPSLYAT
jgi:hypothetical protein